MLEDPRFDYQMYFQEVGRGEAEFDKDPEFSLKCLIRSPTSKDYGWMKEPISLGNVRQRGGMLVGFPKDIPRSVLHSGGNSQISFLTIFRKGFTNVCKSL
jgi:hypothetical protein